MDKDREFSNDTAEGRRFEGRLAGPAADNGSPEEFAGIGEEGEQPEWHVTRPVEVSTDVKLVNGDDEKKFVVVLEQGDEMIGSLRDFAADHQLQAGRFTGIGAFSGVVLGFFDHAQKELKRIVIAEQVEVLSLNGRIFFEEDEPRIEAQVVVAKSDGSAHGGRLIEAHVVSEMEILLEESPKHTRGRFTDELELSLLDRDAA